MAKTHLAELDDRGNVLGVLTSTKKAATDALADETRNLVEWDGHVPAEQAHTRRWDPSRSRWTDAEAKHIAAIEKDRDAGERERKRVIAEQRKAER